MVAVSTLKAEDGKVKCETPEGTVINININQRSCIDSLADAVKNLRMVKKDGQFNQPAKECVSGIHLGVGVSFMSLGFISVMLAIILDVVHADLYIHYAGTHYWAGFPFLVTGALNVVAYKYPKALWVVLSYISLLASLAVSIAAIVFTSNDISVYSWGWRWINLDALCDNVRQRQNGYDYQTRSPRYYDGDFDLQRCKSEFQNYKKLLFGLVIMSLLMMIWGLCVSAITLLYKLKLLCNSCKCEKVEDDKDDDLLSPNPSQDIIIA